jgi:hypothetical protein
VRSQFFSIFLAERVRILGVTEDDQWQRGRAHAKTQRRQGKKVRDRQIDSIAASASQQPNRVSQGFLCA